MKPIKLKICGIGPYAGEMPEIDFRKFQEKSLFLIAGDTGAGKTMIFDAICFSLFGKTSSDRRQVKNLRSEYAKENTLSYVDFYFSHQGKEYHVYREPNYMRPKLRGGGETEHQGTAVFYAQDQDPVEGLNQVNERVVELLGINEKQFKQIAMIAQGDFWQLLNADTRERTEILRTIFMTQGYNSIEFKLKERMDEAARIKENTEASMIQYFRDVKAQEMSEENHDLSLLQNQLEKTGSVWNLSEMLRMIETLIENDRSEYKRIEEELKLREKKLAGEINRRATARDNNAYLERLEQLKEEAKLLEDQAAAVQQKKEGLKKQIFTVRRFYPSYHIWEERRAENQRTEGQLQQYRQNLQGMKVRQKALKEGQKQTEEKQKKAEKYERFVEKIDREEKEYHRKEKLSREELHLTEGIKNSMEAEESFQKREVDLKKQIHQLKERRDLLKNRPEQLIAIQATGGQLQMLYDKARDLEDRQIPRWEEEKKELDRAQQRFIAVRSKYQETERRRKELEMILENCRAGILARGLKEGEKCPVCGSLHHPEPALPPEKQVSEEQLKELQNLEEQHREEKNTANALAEKILVGLEKQREYLLREISECCSDPILKKEAPEVEDLLPGAETDDREMAATVQQINRLLAGKIRENSKEYQSAAEECRELKKAEESLEKLQNQDLERLSSEKKKNEESKIGLEKEIAAVRSALNTIGELSFPNWNIAKEKRDLAMQEAERIHKEIKMLDEERKRVDEAIAKLDSAIETLASGLKSQKTIEEQQEQSWKGLMEEGGYSDVQELLSFLITEDEIRETEDQIRNYDQRVSTNRIRIREAQTQAQGRSYQDIALLEKEIKSLEEQVDALRSQKQEIQARMESNGEKKLRIEKQESTLKNSTKRYGYCKNLYELVRGKTKNGKITLEQYIQASGFDGIIRAANRRLLPISGGQYELYRQESSLGKRSNTFLDLEVLDHYTGRRRPVGSLSGGESFKASLSLALGLSDTVSSNFGGIQMDALFIDEGFGTLDRKSIDNAMDILLNLSETSKLIGIISHREELIENIPQQIRVYKDREGSHFSVETE